MRVLLTTLFFLTAATQAAAAKVPALIFAVQSGRASLYKPIIRKGKALDVTDSKGRTAAHYAIIYNDPRALELLFKHGANPNVTDDKGKTLLDMWRKHADKKARKDVFALLQDAGVYTDLFQATDAADLAAVNSLLAAGENAKAKNADGKNPFVIAAEAENHVLAAILLQATVGINGRDERGWTPLLWAIIADDWKLVRSFISAGAKLISNTRQRQTAYEVAKMMGTERRLLATYVDEMSSGGLADLLIRVVEKQEVADLKLLLEYGAKPNARNHDGQTPLVAAMRLGKTDIAFAEVLLAANADPNAANKFHEFPLHAAALKKDVEAVRLLLDNGADPNVLSSLGQPPLFFAVSFGGASVTVTKLLLDHGADPNVVDVLNSTALSTAVRNASNIDVVKLLLERGADPNHNVRGIPLLDSISDQKLKLLLLDYM